PVLRTHDRYGARIDEVDYHPAYHEVMARAVGLGAHASPWRDPCPGAHVARAAVFMLLAQVEPGHACPISMTYSAVPALRAEPDGLSCFAVPRVLPDGTRNALRYQRLKDKLGDRSNASSEVEYDGAWARLVGEAGRGVRTIIEMVNHTRLDCVLGSTAGMRQA